MYLFIDTETGGLTPDHSLLTLSVIPVDKDFHVVPVEYRCARSGVTQNTDSGLYLTIQSDTYVLSQGALAVNKINIVEHDKTAMRIDQARDTLVSFIKSVLKVFGKKYLVPAGHNVAFDAQFIRAHLLDEQLWNQYFTYPSLDTAAVARFLNAAGIIDGGYSLTALRNKFLPHMRAVDMHNAEVDNLVAIELAKKFVEMCSGRAVPF